MTMLRKRTAKLVKPANEAERTALAQWRQALPVSAMVTLFKAGYTLKERVAFQVRITGCPEAYICDYSDYDLIGM
jgi:hypothetical protein